MIRLFSLLSFLFIFSLIVFGCSGNSSSPMTPYQKPDSATIPLSETDNHVSNQAILGSWTAHFNIESLKVTVIPERIPSAHYNVKSLVPPPEIKINSYDPISNVIDIDVTLTNSFDVDGYDVRLIIYTDDLYHMLLNPDQWTPLYDIPGGDTINPFKAYAKNEPNRKFSSHAQHTENLLIYLPNGNTSVSFTMEASYPNNCKEPYLLENFQHDILYSDAGSVAEVKVDVLDWQGNTSFVSLHCPEITGMGLVQFSQESANTWKLNLVNNTGAYPGSYNAILVAGSSDSGSLVLNDYVRIYVTKSECDPAPEITTTELPIGHLHERYHTQLNAVNGEGNLNWSYTGDLPPGIELMPEGLLTGNPQSMGIFTATFKVEDSCRWGAQTDSIQLDLEIEEELTKISSVQFLEKIAEDTWFDIGVMPDSYVYIVADHPATGNTNMTRTCIQFEHNLANPVVLNPGTGMADVWDNGFTIPFDRCDVTNTGMLSTNPEKHAFALFSVSGDVATDTIDGAWAVSCGSWILGVTGMADIWDQYSLKWGTAAAGYEQITDCGDPNHDSSIFFSDLLNMLFNTVSPPLYNYYEVVAVNGLDLTDNAVFFVSGGSTGYLSISGSWFTLGAPITEFYKTGEFGIEDGEFKGGLDVAVDGDRNIVTLEDHGYDTFRLQKFDENLNWLYSAHWNFDEHPLRMDFDRLDNQLYVLASEGIHILNVE